MRYLTIFFLCVFSVACASGDPDASSTSKPRSTSSSSSDSANSTNKARTASGVDTIRIQSRVPFSKNNSIASNIKNECTLSTALPNFMVAAADNITTVDKPASKSRGKVLIMQITQATSAGNAFIGHRKSATVTGTLYENGKKVASFTARRISGGGMWGGFKGSCSVLNRIMKVVAKDITLWLASPVDGARLGDA